MPSIGMITEAVDRVLSRSGNSLVSPNRSRLVGLAEVRRSYETEFALFPDAHCELRLCVGNSGRGVAESFFPGRAPGREGSKPSVRKW